MKHPTKNYDNLINLPHHVSSTRKQMSVHDRAAQFSPFAALTGYEDAIDETARQTENKVALEGFELEKINTALTFLAAHPQTEVILTYFVADGKKSGGMYKQMTAVVKKVKSHEQVLVLSDGTTVPFDDVLSIESPLFDE